MKLTKEEREGIRALERMVRRFSRAVIECDSKTFSKTANLNMKGVKVINCQQ